MTETKQTDTTNDPRGACASPSAELVAFRELVSQEAAAFAAQHGVHERIVILSDAICARPARSWAEVTERAQIAHYWQDKRPDGSLSGLTSEYAGDRVTRI
jgi:hypothetical protein